MKKRLDVVLVEQGQAQSRERAKAMIMAGIVYVNDQKADKAGITVKEDDRIEVRAIPCGMSVGEGSSWKRQWPPSAWN